MTATPQPEDDKPEAEGEKPDPDDEKLVTLARAARARIMAEHGARSATTRAGRIRVRT